MAHKGMKGSKGSAYAKGEKMPMEDDKDTRQEMMRLHVSKKMGKHDKAMKKGGMGK